MKIQILSFFITVVVATSFPSQSRAEGPADNLAYVYSCDGNVAAISTSNYKQILSLNGNKLGFVNKTKDGCPLTTLFATDNPPSLFLITPTGTEATTDDASRYQLNWVDSYSGKKISSVVLTEALVRFPEIVDVLKSAEGAAGQLTAIVKFSTGDDDHLASISLQPKLSADAINESLVANETRPVQEQLVDGAGNKLLKTMYVDKRTGKMVATANTGVFPPSFPPVQPSPPEWAQKYLSEPGWMALQVSGSSGVFVRETKNNTEFATIDSTSDFHKIDTLSNISATRVNLAPSGEHLFALAADNMLWKLNLHPLEIDSKTRIGAKGEDTKVLCVADVGALVRTAERLLFVKSGHYLLSKSAEVHSIDAGLPIDDQLQCVFEKKQ